MISISIKPQTSIEQWSVNIGRDALTNASQQLNKVFRNKGFIRELKKIIAGRLIKNINLINLGVAKIPIFSGEYVTSYIAGIVAGFYSPVELMGLLKQAGRSAARKRKISDSERIKRIARSLMYSQSSYRYIPVINTGGGLNPNMAFISSFILYGGKKHPFYTKNIEETGWGKVPSYDIRAWDAVFKQFYDENFESEVIDLIGRYL